MPGTNVRFGWDAIIGVVPWAGDLLSALLGSAILVEAGRQGVPRLIQLRMLVNLAADLAIGAIPVAGDVADVFWKANTRNLALFERYLGRRRASPADWLFAAGVVIAIVAVALLPLLVLTWLLGAVSSRGWL